MDDSPLNGVTEMMLGSDTKGMLLVNPPSKHRWKGNILFGIYKSWIKSAKVILSQLGIK